MSELLNRIDLRFDFVEAKLAQHSITESGCWEYRGAKSEEGYGVFTIYDPVGRPSKRKFRAHRVSFAFHHGIDPGALLVCHKCDNPSCINPDHLFLGTDKDNAQDRLAKGRSASQHGEKNPRSKITPEIVEFVVGAIRAGNTNIEIASALPITHAQVSLIRLGKSWRKVTEQLNYNPDDGRQFTRKSESAL